MIMAGQGTAALELLEETGPLDALITPVGGGGLLAGSATIAKAIAAGDPHFRRRAGRRQRYLSFPAGGEPVTVPHPDTIADGLRSPRPGSLTFPVVRTAGGTGSAGER